MPQWVDHAVWWQVYPLGFVGADTTGARRTLARTLGDLVGWLDYAVELGVSGIALGPIFRSSTHGYDTIDHFTIDDRLGDERTFARLVEQCHARGLRLMLDGVFNHVGRAFPVFKRARIDLYSGDASWFIPMPDGDVLDETAFRIFEGHPGLITLNHEWPAVADYVVDVMRYWLTAGADGWRLDAAYAVPRKFWANVLPRVRLEHPDAYIVGEVIHGDYTSIVRESSMDSVTQYELWKAIWSSLNDRNFFELAWALKRHNKWLETFVPMTFVGNHDVTRLASRIEDTRHLGHALALIFTVGGTPSVYYGDEQGFRGIKEERGGGDDAIRPEFPIGGPNELAPFGWSVYRLHQLLIGFRRRHPWLHKAITFTNRLTKTFFAYECRHGKDRIIVALNLSDTMESVDIPPGLQSVLQDSGGPEAAVRDGRLVVPAHRWAIGH